ncbi:sulfate ABC transporter ATP-binding protein [Desulfuromonas carbonis]|uniref:sulfate/molybdate ABC transporter ATP-binding protein n=1 Tax=Desulfuromonas sp. DDH964 TaxID=1823759 RepID=UPI00078E3D59|nr:sulfate ABC transporter ATP-binding protein [Desulfuromonas sp. DDH964]AMV70579.1 sulfate ABC transporter ATP-binding protein [Desulfuromonas sp. DDH964]
MEAGIEVRNIRKTFGSFCALDNVSLVVPAGKLMALLGPSGSGKTTLLRIIAGLEAADAGSIFLQGEDVTGVPVRKRRIGFVFQHYALFRNMRVFDNVAFGLKVQKRRERLSRAEIRDRVFDLLRLVQLEDLSARYPSQLSGGQRQRIALARTLATDPKVLLLDEPFGALDAKVRQELRRWLVRLHDELHITSLFVTHDQVEALEVADQVVIMNEGRIEQTGTPEQIYNQPATPFVYNFLGHVNVFHGVVQAGLVRIGNVEVCFPELRKSRNRPVVAFVRPQDLAVSDQQESPGEVEARVVHLHSAGPTALVELESADGKELLEAEMPPERLRLLNLREGDRVFVRPLKMQVFEENEDPAQTI